MAEPRIGADAGDRLRSSPLPLAGLTVAELGHAHYLRVAGSLLARLGATVVVGDRTPQSGTGDTPIESARQRLIEDYLDHGKQRVSASGMPAAVDLLLATHHALSAPDCAPVAACTVAASTYGDGTSRTGWAESPLTRLHAGGIGYVTPAGASARDRPLAPGRLAIDHLAGVGLAFASLAALVYHRRATTHSDRRVYVDFSVREYLVNLNKMFLHLVTTRGQTINRANHGYPYGGILRTLDGYVAVMVIEEHQWLSLCTMLGRPEWREDPRFADGVKRVANCAVIQSTLEHWCVARTNRQVLDAATLADVPASAVADGPALLGDASLRERGFLVDRPPDGVTTGLPFGTRFLHTPAADRPAGPLRDRGAVVAPLSGIRVLDLTWMAAGPFATTLFAYLGAEVVKVESASRPDVMRTANKSYGWSDDADLERSPLFLELAAGKRSIAIDLGKADGRALARALALEADIVIDNMRPGKVEALGLGYDALSALRPGLIACSVSATGRSSSQEPAVPGYAPIFWAAGGGAWLTGEAEGPPGYMRAPVDFHAGACGALGVLAALYRRIDRGYGAYVDCSAVEAVALSIGEEIHVAGHGGRSRGRQGNDLFPYAPNDVFPCRGDDRWLAISVDSDDQWQALCDELIPGAPELRSLSGADRWSRRAELYRSLAGRTALRERDELETALGRRGVAVAASRGLDELLTEPDLVSRGFWIHAEHPALGRQQIAGPPWRAPWRAPDLKAGGPLLGADTGDVVRRWLGWTGAQIAPLDQAGVLR